MSSRLSRCSRRVKVRIQHPGSGMTDSSDSGGVAGPEEATSRSGHKSRKPAEDNGVLNQRHPRILAPSSPSSRRSSCSETVFPGNAGFSGPGHLETQEEPVLNVILGDGVDGGRGKICFVNPSGAGHLLPGVVTRVLIATALWPLPKKAFLKQGGSWVLSFY